MQLSNEKVIREGYVTDRHGKLLSDSDSFDANLFSQSSFNLKVREILAKCDKGPVVDDGAVGSDHGVRNPLDGRIEPQQTVYVLSEERLSIPHGFIAYVFLKNKLSQKGLLALNTGIIDPGFNGPISTMLVNLSSEVIELPTGEPFFRVVFHQVEASTDSRPPKNYSYEEYRSYRIKDLIKLPKDFQNSDVLKTAIDSELRDRVLSINAKNLAVIVALFTALLLIVPPIVQMLIDCVRDDRLVSLEAEVGFLRERLREEQGRVENLEHRIQSQSHLLESELLLNMSSSNAVSNQDVQKSPINSDKSSEP